MKKNIIAFVCVMHTILMAHANTTSIVTPQAKESFKKQFPRALYATWENVDAGVYAVRFVNNNSSIVAYYTEDGSSLGLGRILAPSKITTLPAGVQQTLSGVCKDCKVLSAQEWILPDSRVYYFDVLTTEGAFAVGIDENGKLQKRKLLQHF